MLDLRFRIKAVQVSGLPFSPLWFFGGLRFYGSGFRVWGLRVSLSPPPPPPPPPVVRGVFRVHGQVLGGGYQGDTIEGGGGEITQNAGACWAYRVYRV